jgi:hypothetical protein
MSFSADYKTFAEHWLCRPLKPDDSVPVPAEVKLPLALAEIYQVFGAAISLTRAHNQLLQPDELTEQDGFVIFYIEDQEAALWAYAEEDAAMDDPTVHQGSLADDGQIEWQSEEMTMSQWIRVMSWWQLINGGYDHGAFIEKARGANKLIETGFPFLGEHRAGAIRFFGSPGQILCIAGDDREASVWIAGRTRDDYEALDAKLKLAWDFSSDGVE